MLKIRNCCPWEHDAELLATERIKEGSLKKPLGNACKCLPLSCYERACVTRMYLLTSMLIVVGIIFIAFRIPGFLENQQQVNTMEPTECTTVSSSLAATELSCNTCDYDKEQPECVRNYPCLLVIVSYQAGDTPVGNSLLYRNYDSLIENRQCLVNGAECKTWDPFSAVDELNKQLGSVGTKFACFYNRDDIKKVAFKAPDEISWIIWLIIGCIFAGAGLILMLLSLLTFPCYHNCSRSPPEEIQLELERRPDTHSSAYNWRVPVL